MKLRNKAIIVVLLVATFSGAAYVFKNRRAETSVSVLAVVNGKNITTADVDGLILAGMTKPVAVETAISRALVAEAARSAWPKEAEALAEAGAREALAAFYVKKKLADLRQVISDDEINRYYEANIKDEMYAGQGLKYYLTQDGKDAAEMAEAIKKSPDAVAGKFSWVNKDGDHAVLPVATPYGLYQQVKTMQAGQYSGPFNVRDGLLFLRLEDRKPGKRPDLLKVKEDIRALVAQRRLDEESKELREKADIHLH